VLSVKLKSGHDYALSVNNPTFQNFRSKAAEPAVPYPISFTTAGKAADAGPALTKEDNAKAVEALRKFLAEDYSYVDLPAHKVDCDAALKEAGPKLEGWSGMGEGRKIRCW
jgi:hypothetical protein